MKWLIRYFKRKLTETKEECDQRTRANGFAYAMTEHYLNGMDVDKLAADLALLRRYGERGPFEDGVEKAIACIYGVIESTKMDEIASAHVNELDFFHFYDWAVLRQAHELAMGNLEESAKYATIAEKYREFSSEKYEFVPKVPEVQEQLMFHILELGTTQSSPETRTYVGVHHDCTIAIGKDHTATLTIDAEALAELYDRNPQHHR